MTKQSKSNTTETTQEHHDHVILGTSLMILTGWLFSIIAALFGWGSRLGYGSMQMLLIRTIILLPFAMIFG